jgi:hypothetical protein
LVYRFGSRILAVLLTVLDGEDNALEVMVVCTYAPTTAAPAAEKDELLAQLSACIVSRLSHEVLMIEGDFNAALGKCRADEHEQRLRRSVLGPWNVERQNAEGNALLELIVEHDLCVAQFFQKKQYATWFHPGTRLGYQHDLLLVSKPDLKRVGDAGRRPIAAVESNHTPLWVRRDVPRRSLQRFNSGGTTGELPAREPSAGPARPAKHDTSALRDPATRAKYVNDVREAIREHPSHLLSLPTIGPPASPPTITPLPDQTSNRFATLANMDEARTEELARAEDDRRAALLSSFGVLQAYVR